MKVKWLFFDVGSTLVDETKAYEARFEKIAESAGVSKDYVIEKAHGFYEENRKGDKEVAQLLNVDIPKWFSECEYLYPDTVDILESLSKKYKIGVIANQDYGTEDRL